MRSFTDNAGRTWTVALNIGAVKRVKGLLSVDLLAMLKGDPPLITQLGTDVVLLCDVIFAILKPQADEAGVTDEQFGAALSGDAILSARRAFYEELADFFLHMGRPDVARALEMQDAMIVASVAEAQRRVEAIDPTAEVKAIWAEGPQVPQAPTATPEAIPPTPGA